MHIAALALVSSYLFLSANASTTETLYSSLRLLLFLVPLTPSSLPYLSPSLSLSLLPSLSFLLLSSQFCLPPNTPLESSVLPPLPLILWLLLLLVFNSFGHFHFITSP